MERVFLFAELSLDPGDILDLLLEELDIREVVVDDLGRLDRCLELSLNFYYLALQPLVHGL